jgi:hypothetical protein
VRKLATRESVERVDTVPEKRAAADSIKARQELMKTARASSERRVLTCPRVSGGARYGPAGGSIRPSLPHYGVMPNHSAQ